MKIQNTIQHAFFIGLFLAMFLFALPTAHAATNANQTNNPVVSNLRLPFNQTVFVTNGEASELVDFSGNIHLVVKVFLPPNPIVPPNPVRVHTNMMNVSGVGQTSGLRYRLTGAANFEFPANAPGSFSFGASYRLLPPNPIRQSALSQFIRYDISLNSDGEVTEAEALPGIIFTE
jgi:hypothetical protein